MLISHYVFYVIILNVNTCIQYEFENNLKQSKFQSALRCLSGLEKLEIINIDVDYEVIITYDSGL